MTPEEQALIEAACTAHRDRAVDGTIQFHPAWYDLDAGGRRVAFERALRTRVIESALDPDGLSTTARAVLARLGNQ